MKMIVYIGQIILLSGLLYGYYHLFLRNKAFHRYNRFYLLIAAVMSLLMPFISIPVSWPGQQTTMPVVVKMLEKVYADTPDNDMVISNTTQSFTAMSVNWSAVIIILYCLVALFLLSRMIYGLLKLRGLALRYPSEDIGGIKVFRTSEPGTPFSFFNLIFWNEDVELQSVKGQQILRHEMTHVRQKHSYDVFFTELITILFWVNPFFHLIRKEIRIIHEFLADEPAAAEENKAAYAELLLMHSFSTQQSLVNPFFHNQIKRRIAMITKPQTNRSGYRQRLMILPLAVLLFGMVAFRLKPASSSASNRDQITVVVDAGHGGFDPGSKSPDNKIEEAAMTLEFATIMQRLAPEYGINVVLTRENNEAIGATKQDDLKNRVVKTKDARPALFLSFHINTSYSKNKAEFQNTLSGFEAYISEKNTQPGSQEIASALLNKLSGIYKTATTIGQRKDAGIYVLDKNTCPSVMLQCGFINNKKDMEYFSDKKNQEEVVRAILSVIKDNVKA
jgi:N-acetylmuramoyl-L-alanine amidase